MTADDARVPSGRSSGAVAGNVTSRVVTVIGTWTSGRPCVSTVKVCVASQRHGVVQPPPAPRTTATSVSTTPSPQSIAIAGVAYDVVPIVVGERTHPVTVRAVPLATGPITDGPRERGCGSAAAA